MTKKRGAKMRGRKVWNQETRKSFNRRTFLKATAGTAVIAGAPAFIRHAGASKLRKVNFQLAWILTGEYGFAFVAKELGFWEKEGLDVQLNRGFGSSRTAKEVSGGNFDVGEASFGSATMIASQGGALVAMGARNQRCPIGFSSIRLEGKKQLRSPKDLEGMRLGSSAGSGAYQLLPAFAKATGVDIDKIERVVIPPGAYVSSMLNRKIDVVATYYGSHAPPLLAKGIEFDFLFFEDYGFYVLDQTFLAHPRRLQQDKDLYRTFVQGALKATAYCYLNPKKAIDITMKHLALYGNKGKGPEARKLVKFAQSVTTARGLSPLVEEHGIGWMDPPVVRDTVDKVVKYMGASAIKDIESLYTNEFIGNVRLTPEQWKEIRAWAEPYWPSMAAKKS